MNQTKVSKIKILAKSVVFLGLFTFSLNVFAQWTGPSANPPSGNLYVPINSSSNAQSKLGTLTITNGGLGIFGPVQFDSKLLKIFGLQYTWPDKQSKDSFLKNDGTGVLSWSAGGLVSSTGTKDYIPRFTPNDTTLGNSIMYQDPITNYIGINTTTPTSELSIKAKDATGGAIEINPFVDKNTGYTSELRFLETANNGVNYVGLKAPNSIAANNIWTLPDKDGQSGEVLSTNGTGVLSWTSGSGGPWVRTGTNVVLKTPTDFVGVGGAPTAKFEVVGTDAHINDLVVGRGNKGTAPGNTALGIGVLVNTYGLLGDGIGINNTGIGWHSLNGNISGTNNTAVGYDALSSETNTNYNVSIGASALKNLTSGNYNVAIGATTPSTGSGAIAKGTNNVMVGYDAYVGSNYNNSIAIGAHATSNADNKAVIGDANVKTVGGYADWTPYSDRRLKENITYTNKLGLDFVMKLKPVSYNYIADTNKNRRDGLIAQDVKQALDELNVPFSGLVIDNDPMQTENLSYESFVIPLITSTQQLKKENDDIANRITALEEKLKANENKN